jgi:septum formation protein
MSKLICLASGSKSRRTVLERAHVRFIAVPSTIEEIYEGETAKEYVAKLARLKAHDVLDRVNADIIVAADSVALLDAEIIEKPKDREDACTILQTLQGTTHQFLTGSCIIDTASGEEVDTVTITQVTFSGMSSGLIEAYVDRFEPYTFAGGYDNSISSWFIESITGSQSNLMGLPMTVLRETIEGFGYPWFDFIQEE